VESMSQVPLLFPSSASSKFGKLAKARTLGNRLSALASFRSRDFKPVPALLKGLTDPTCDLGMGQTAELLARDFRISRERQDRFALHSHQKALDASERLREEIIPTFDYEQSPMLMDDGPRADSSLEKLNRLRPIFERKYGSVTAGNSSQVTDGAVALLVANEDACNRYGLSPIGRLIDWAYAGCEPSRMGLGPAYALAKGRVQGAPELSEIDLIELNEAFAAQAIAVMEACRSEKFCHEKLGLDRTLGEMNEEIVNVNGGAIALGHPVGATGSRLVLTALHELKRRNQKTALATLCVGGGQGGALWLERN
jgi:acetyl-CoA acetyltransferase family protein